MVACLAAFFFALWGATFALLPRAAGAVRSAVGRLARWLSARVRAGAWLGRLETWRSFLPLAVALAIGALVIAATADTFVDIAAALNRESPAVRRIDAGVQEWFRSRRSAPASAVFTAITAAGGSVSMGGLVLVVVAAFLARRRRRWAAYLALTAVGGVLLNQLLKRHFVRPRPDLASAVLGATGYSFPSGHAMSATIVLGALGYLAARSARSWAVKSAAFSAFATLALAIGVSRLYLGVHWASDVVAGFAAGALWVTAATTGYELVRQYRLLRAGGVPREAAPPSR